MGARSKARKRALDVLYAADLRREDPLTILERTLARADGPLNPYVTTLVRGVTEHRERIDELLASYAQGWSLERMPAVDRNVLRLGIFETVFSDDVPGPVAVSEAMALVRELSTADSPVFVNGVLGAILRDGPARESAVVPDSVEPAAAEPAAAEPNAAEPAQPAAVEQAAVEQAGPPQPAAAQPAAVEPAAVEQAEPAQPVAPGTRRPEPDPQG